MSFRFGIALLTVLFVLTGGAWAGTVTVVNPSFEDSPVDGWTFSAANVYTTPAGSYNADATIPVGTEVGWANNGTISQLLGSVSDILANTTYDLNVWVGWRNNNATSYSITNAEIELLAFNGSSSTVLATAASPDPSQGEWVDWNASFDSASAGLTQYVGQELEIELVSTQAQANFDDVTVTYNADGSGGGGVPEPAMFALVGAGLLGLVTRRRFAK